MYSLPTPTPNIEYDIHTAIFSKLRLILPVMSKATNGGRATDSWSVLASGEWETGDELLVRLTDAMRDIGPDDGTVLYDHVAIDAMLDALAPSGSRGVSEIRFEYGRYEIKVTQAGVIAASPDPATSPQSPEPPS